MKIRSVLSFILLFYCSIHSTFSQIRNAPLTAKDSELASQNYQRYCALCHGTEREGNAADLASRFDIDLRSFDFWEKSLQIIGKRVDRYIQI